MNKLNTKIIQNLEFLYDLASTQLAVLTPKYNSTVQQPQNAPVCKLTFPRNAKILTKIDNQTYNKCLVLRLSINKPTASSSSSMLMKFE